jgi:hypothetical protein
MDWNKDSLERLDLVLQEAWERLRLEKRTDRGNLSHLWNLKLTGVGAEVVRHRQLKSGAYNPGLMVSEFVRLMNERNDLVSDSVCVMNPDRAGQFVLMKRDVASKIMMLGLP